MGRSLPCAWRAGCDRMVRDLPARHRVADADPAVDLDEQALVMRQPLDRTKPPMAHPGGGVIPPQAAPPWGWRTSSYGCS